MDDGNIELVKRLIEIMNENDLAEIEVEQDGVHVRLRRQEPAQSPSVTHVVAAGVAPAVEPNAADVAQEEDESAGLEAVTAALVGTYYSAPSPDSDPYVEVDDEVEEDTVVCVIEAMKVFNEICAEKRGRIVKVLVFDGDAVEYGQPLFLIDPKS